MKKQLIALLVFLLVGSTVSFAIDSNDSSSIQVEGVKNIVDLENYLHENYGSYIIDKETSQFKYELKEYVDYVRVKVQSKNLDKISIDIDDKDADLDKLIQMISEEINRNLKKDISFYIYNSNDNVVVKYKYIAKQSTIEKIYNDKRDYSIRQLEKDLNNNYASYGDVGKELEFKYELNNTPEFIRLTMEGQGFGSLDFNWKNRNAKDFRSFIKGMAQEIDYEFGKGVYIDIYPEKTKYGALAKYEYDENNDILKIIKEGTLTQVDKFDNINDKDIEEKIVEDNSSYLYSKGRYDLMFKIKIQKNKYDTIVEIDGENFNKESLKWLDRDNDDFEDFIKDIAKSVTKQYPNDLKINVYDEKNEIAGKYEYDIDNDSLDVKFEEKYDNHDLNYYYGNYIDEKSSLEFEYKIEHKVSYPQLFEEEVKASQYIAVSLYGQNFNTSSTSWKEKDDEKFESFIELIAQEVSRKYDSYVILTIFDRHNRLVERYNYGKIDEKRLYPYSDYNGTLDKIDY